MSQLCLNGHSMSVWLSATLKKALGHRGNRRTPPVVGMARDGPSMVAVLLYSVIKYKQ